MGQLKFNGSLKILKLITLRTTQVNTDAWLGEDWVRYELEAQVLPSLSLGDEGVTYSLCWTTDLDYFFHMNNGKYFREMDFAR